MAHFNELKKLQGAIKLLAADLSSEQRKSALAEAKALVDVITPSHNAGGIIAQSGIPELFRVACSRDVAGFFVLTAHHQNSVTSLIPWDDLDARQTDMFLHDIYRHFPKPWTFSRVLNSDASRQSNAQLFTSMIRLSPERACETALSTPDMMRTNIAANIKDLLIPLIKTHGENAITQQHRTWLVQDAILFMNATWVIAALHSGPIDRISSENLPKSEEVKKDPMISYIVENLRSAHGLIELKCNLPPLESAFVRPSVKI